MNKSKIINCLYGGIAVEGIMVIKKFKYLFASNIGIDFMATGMVIPYWFILLIGLIPLAPIASKLAVKNKEIKISSGVEKEENINKICGLLSTYSSINKEE